MAFVVAGRRRYDMTDRKLLPGKSVWFELVSRDAKKAQAFDGEVPHHDGRLRTRTERKAWPPASVSIPVDSADNQGDVVVLFMRAELPNIVDNRAEKGR